MATLTAQHAAFIQEMTPYAAQAAAATGWTQQLILAQWANETAWGTSTAFKNNFNLAGIGITTPNAKGQVSGSLADGVQAYINFVNENTNYAGVKTAGAGLTPARKTQAQAAALAASPWASGHYTGGAGLPLNEVTGSIANISGVAAGNAATYSTASGIGAAATTATSGTAAASIDAVLKSAGLTSLIPWANTLATTLAAKGLGASAIATTLQTQIQTQPAFQSRFPGLKTRVANGFPALSITEYLHYETSAKSMGKAAGLPTGFMTNTEIGKLIANDVSITELSTRLTKAYAVAANAPPETKALLTSYFGIKTGTLAAYFLTPAKATKVIQNQLTAAQIGTAGVQAGFNLPKPAPTATLGKLPPTGQPGRVTLTPLYLAQVGVSSATAHDTFQSLAKLLPLTEGLPGTGGETTSLTSNELVNYGFFGTNAEQLANVEQARTAPFHGGGGYVQSAKGVLGAGYGTASGSTGT